MLPDLGGDVPLQSETGMNELRRMAYLDALGIDSYVSRRQLPGAAASRRVVIVSKSRTADSIPAGNMSAGNVTGVPTAAPMQHQSTPGIVWPERNVGARTERNADSVVHSTQPVVSVPRFTLTTIVAGEWLWLEELAGLPLTSEQVQLVQSMAQALLVKLALRDAARSPGAARESAARPGAARPDIMQFDWPIHSNRQLDQGEEAARAGVAGFLVRRLEQHGCRGLVMLGQTGAARVAVEQLGVTAVCTASSADMLAMPALKRQAWRDLLPLAG